MIKRLLIIALVLPTFMLLFTACDSEIKPAKELAGRIMGEKSGMLRFKTLKDETKDVYEIETVGNHIVIRGNNANSMAVGLGRYLQDYCLTQVSWYDFNPVELPQDTPCHTGIGNNGSGSSTGWHSTGLTCRLPTQDKNPYTRGCGESSE